MSMEDAKTVVQRYIDEVQNEHNLDVLDDIFAHDFAARSETFPGVGQGIEGLRQFYDILFSAFPDVRVTAHQMLAEQDRVVTHKTFSGTHLGEFLGIQPTGRRVEFDLIDVLRVADGKITDFWGVFDRLTLMQQVGAIQERRSAA
jgi:steroid delta-isomerase-like uncharacterized protein